MRDDNGDDDDISTWLKASEFSALARLKGGRGGWGGTLCRHGDDDDEE